MKTINGQSISEEQIDEWVMEAEKGYDVETLRTRGRKPPRQLGRKNHLDFCGLNKTE